MAKKKKKWLKFRHRIVRNLVVWCILKPYIRIKYRAKIRKFKQQGKRQYLIMMNHQTPFDQFFIMLSFKRPVYILASEDLFSNGKISKFIRWAIAPIPIKKQATDARAVLDCMRVVKEGGTIALAPEGNRTYSGKTEYFKPAIVGFARALKLPVAIYKIEGGYGAQPRWADDIRKGKMTAGVTRVIEPEEYKSLSDEEFYELIKAELYVNENQADCTFKSKRLAEYLERVVYECPYCGLSTFESKKDVVRCKRCDREIRYLPTKELQGVGFKFPFRFVGEWYDHQCEFMNSLDLSKYEEQPMWTERARLLEVILYKNKKLIHEDAELTLYGNRLEVLAGEEKLCFTFDEAHAFTVLGRNKLNVYHGGRVYQFKGDKRFNALKFVHTFYRYQNLKKGDENGKFLGL
jgi:1-acyl-sn-glycerol-3-phosphate acyltransferase